uniref:Uncharacterized protein n=1 Tax=Nelumbo nucifera TaxID=4432 RepID=A0A822YJF9_NELNU|nr:TPA_asm: hypothetical protein HUJ06_010300 [Nelumbo nucifera]
MPDKTDLLGANFRSGALLCTTYVGFYKIGFSRVGFGMNLMVSYIILLSESVLLKFNSYFLFQVDNGIPTRNAILGLFCSLT